MARFPGGGLVEKGLRDLREGVLSEEALLVSVARPRLLALGLDVPDLLTAPLPHEHRLFEAIEARMTVGAHAEYNALIAKIVSFANAYQR